MRPLLCRAAACLLLTALAVGVFPARADQPRMQAAARHLQAARDELSRASSDKGGHRQRALDLVERALREARAGIEYDRSHTSKEEKRLDHKRHHPAPRHKH